MSASILIIEDDINAGTALARSLSREGYQVDLERDGESGLSKALHSSYDLVLSDIVMPGMDGMSVFRELRKKKADTQIIMMTAHGTVDMAVNAMKEGATDFLEKPLNIDRVRVQVAKALTRSSLIKENKQLKQRLQDTYKLDKLIGEDEAMKKLIEQVKQVAPSPIPILILGESGTGKELIANALHELSDRSDKPFIKINCAALPNELLQSELFGHEKGAFTGATSSRKGRFEEADKGTIFLDEIGDLPPQMQVKLLRFLQEGTFERLGDNVTRHVDVRLITATHVDLEQALKEDKMREDFYYRIKGISLHIPPLRKRKGDIPLLARHFLKEYAPQKSFSKEALKALSDFKWPGNIRQLRHICEQVSVLSNGDVIAAKDFPPELSDPTPITGSQQPNIDFPLMPLEEAEKILIEKALESTNGNKTEAARILGIGLRTLYRKIDSK